MRTILVLTLIAVQCALSTALSQSNLQPNNTIIESIRNDRSAVFVPIFNFECAADYVVVSVDFAEVFVGVIYSKGFYNDPKCRYAYESLDGTRYSFRVPLKGCGSTSPCKACGTIENTIVFQQYDMLEGPGDFARKVSCTSSYLQVMAGTPSNGPHTLKLKPFSVESTSISVIEGTGEALKCWMDIQKGVFPDTTPIEDSFKVGESLSIMVYLLDVRKEYDLKIHDCWAYDSEDYDNPNTRRVQLTDTYGCPKTKTLISIWQKTTNTGSSGATLIAYSKVSAFRFQESEQVYLTCNVELCQSNCDSQCGSAIQTVIIKPKCFPGSRNPECERQTAEIGITQGPNCFHGSTDPRCESQTSSINTAKGPDCFPGSRAPQCRQKPPPPPPVQKPDCYPGSPDPKCPNSNRTRLTPNLYLPPRK